MDQYRDFSPGNILPSTWADAVEALLSGFASGNFKLTVASNTSVQIAGVAHDEPTVAMRGKLRWNSINATGNHPGGVAGSYDVYVTSNPDTFGTDGSGYETDTTDHSFGLKVSTSVPSGTGAETYYRKIGEVDWDGTQITGFRQTFGPHANTHTVYALSPNVNVPPIYGKSAASAVAPLARLDNNSGTEQFSVSNTGTVNARVGYNINGTALASTHLSDSSSLARLAGPTFTGVPAAPTAAPGTNTTQIATTAFVAAAVAAAPGGVTSVFGRSGAVVAASGDYAVAQVTGAAPLASPTFTGTVTLPSLVSTSTTLGFYGQTPVVRNTGWGATITPTTVGGGKAALSSASTLNDVIDYVSNLASAVRALGAVGT